MRVTSGSLGLLQLYLTFSVINIRKDNKISLGHGGDKQLEARIRGHGNLTETAPMLLILTGLIEMNQCLPLWALKVVCGTALVGRISHAYAFLYDHPKDKHFRFRVFGMVSTLTCIGIESAALLFFSVPKLIE